MDAVALDSVCFRYAKAKEDALKNISLQIPRGSFFALLGENGAGKTTLMRLVCGRLLCSSGVLNYASDLQKNDQADLSQFGTLIENPGDYPRLTVLEYLEFFGKLYGVKNLGNRIREVLQGLDFQFDLNLKVGALSLGNRQKLQVARAVLHSPKILLLDEPAANLDPVARESLWNSLSRFRKEQNATLVVSSHILPELDKYATHYAVLKKGCIAMQGSVGYVADSSTLQIAKNDMDRAVALLKNAGIECKMPDESRLTTLYKKAMLG